MLLTRRQVVATRSSSPDACLSVMGRPGEGVPRGGPLRRDRSISEPPDLLTRRPRKKSLISQSSYLYDERSPGSCPLLRSLPTLKLQRVARGLYLLYRTEDQRPLSKPKASIRLEGSQKACRSRRAGVDPDCTGHDGLRGRSQGWDDSGKASHGLVKVNGLRWIRILYSYPKARYFTDELLSLWPERQRSVPTSTSHSTHRR